VFQKVVDELGPKRRERGELFMEFLYAVALRSTATFLPAVALFNMIRALHLSPEEARTWISQSRFKENIMDLVDVENLLEWPPGSLAGKTFSRYQ